VAVVAKKPPIDLAVIMGGPMGKKPGGSSKGGEDDEEEDAPESRPMGEHKQHDEGDDLPAGFEEAFSEAFPEAAGDTDRMQAVKRLIHLCAGSY